MSYKNNIGNTKHKCTTPAAKNGRVDENMAGDFGVTGLVQKGFNAMGITFKGTAREAYAILLAYFRDTTGNMNAARPLYVIGLALNTLINKKKNRVDIEDDGEYAQSIGGAAFSGALDLTGTRGMMKGGTKIGTRMARKAGTTALAKGAGTAAKAIAGPVGWAMLGADLINDAINIVNACKNAKQPTRAPKKAIDTLKKFFNRRGSAANTQNVQAALKTLSSLVAADERKTMNRRTAMNNRQNTNTMQNTLRNSQGNRYPSNRLGNTANNRMVAENKQRNAKKVIRLTENDLNRMVMESLNEAINEFGVLSLGGTAASIWAAKKFLKSKAGKYVLNLVRKEGIPALEKFAKNHKWVEKALKNKTVRKYVYGEAADEGAKKAAKQEFTNAAKNNGGFTSTSSNGSIPSFSSSAGGNTGTQLTKQLGGEGAEAAAKETTKKSPKLNWKKAAIIGGTAAAIGGGSMLRNGSQPQQGPDYTNSGKAATTYPYGNQEAGAVDGTNGAGDTVYWNKSGTEYGNYRTGNNNTENNTVGANNGLNDADWEYQNTNEYGYPEDRGGKNFNSGKKRTSSLFPEDITDLSGIPGYGGTSYRR